MMISCPHLSGARYTDGDHQPPAVSVIEIRAALPARPGESDAFLRARVPVPWDHSTRPRHALSAHTSVEIPTA